MLFRSLSALTYAVYLVGSGRLLPRLGTLRFTSSALSFACLAVLLSYLFSGQNDLFSQPAVIYGYALLMAIFATVMPVFLISEGIRVIGANNASIIGSVGPIATIVLAYFFLGETLDASQWAGTVLVILGVILVGKG